MHRDLLLGLLKVLWLLLLLLPHSLYLLFGQAALVIGDSDALGLAGALLVGAHRQDAVLIDLEGYLNLRYTSGSRWDTVQIKLAELMVVLDEGTFAFEDSDGYSGLLVLVGREGL